MSINQVQFHKSLRWRSSWNGVERYGTEPKCHAALVASRWTEGLAAAAAMIDTRPAFGKNVNISSAIAVGDRPQLRPERHLRRPCCR